MARETLQESTTHAPWQREFMKNIDTFIEAGLDKKDAARLMQRFMELSASTPLPAVMETFRDETALERVGVYTERQDDIRDFMLEFFKPLLSKFKLEGKDNIETVHKLIEGGHPLTLVSNHLSHFDTAAMYCLLYLAGGKARKLADSMVFIAGRLVFTPDFTRTALYMINSLLVCSKRDMAENPTMGDLMTRINMRSFRQAQQLQKEGKVIAVFPEGTRSRTGRLLTFVDTVYHYVGGKIIIPVSLAGTDKILPTDSFLFKITSGQVTIGRPFMVGRPHKGEVPPEVDLLEIPDGANKKQFVIDSLAVYIGRNLDKNKHGSYRNLYLSKPGMKDSNVLIAAPEQPIRKVVVIGHSRNGISTAAILANKPVRIRVFIPDEAKVAAFNESRTDEDHFPHFKLPPNISFTANPADLLDSDLFIQAVRTWEIDLYYSKLKEILVRTHGPIVNVVKGLTGSKYGLLFDDLQHLYGIDPVRFVALAGANYPEQIMERKFSGFELAAINTSLVNQLAELFNTGYVSCRPAINPYDVKGVLLGGALKNIYALGIGLIDGYYEDTLGGNSDNSLFHFSSQIFDEMKKIGSELGGVENTFLGLSGMTDLMLSCFGQDSHDRQFGHDFYMGMKEVPKQSSGLYALSQMPRFIDLKEEKYPLMSAIHSILIKKKDADKVLGNLLDDYQKTVLMH